MSWGRWRDLGDWWQDERLWAKARWKRTALSKCRTHCGNARTTMLYISDSVSKAAGKSLRMRALDRGKLYSNLPITWSGSCLIGTLDGNIPTSCGEQMMRLISRNGQECCRLQICNDLNTNPPQSSGISGGWRFVPKDCSPGCSICYSVTYSMYVALNPHSRQALKTSANHTLAESHRYDWLIES